MSFSERSLISILMTVKNRFQKVVEQTAMKFVMYGYCAERAVVGGENEIATLGDDVQEVVFKAVACSVVMTVLDV